VVVRSANERDPAPLIRHLEDLSANVTRCERLGGLDRDTQLAVRVVMRRGLELLNIDLGRAIELLSAGGGTMHVPGDSDSVSVTRRLVGLEPAKPTTYIRSRGERLDRQAGDAASGVIAAVTMESERLLRLASEPPRLAIPSATINAYGERCFEIDKVLEEEVIAMLARHGGVKQVLSEESGVIPIGPSGLTVVLDPIDGTKNYKMGLSYYALSMAILSDAGTVSGGLVLNLAAGTQYSAIRGRGAFRNGRRITAGAPPLLGAVDVIFVGLSKEATELGALSGIASSVSSFRAMGCAALDLCCLATGNIGLFVDLSNTAKAVDVLAAALIAEEAGALVTTTEGEPILDGVGAAADVVETIYNWRFRTLGAATDELHSFCVEQCRGLLS
jgi:myo-inositol-1(or 4)-monophosphatase